ncbi:MAG: hypothetical protein IKO41_17800 [Lachnospiraceae bacterium]|nr:hypothetical protein [Lachnospiraceae bacterium]
MKNIKITLENFSEENRTRRIGNSQYRICRNEKGTWYIAECYNDGIEWSKSNGFHSEDLGKVIDRFNSLNGEKQVITARREGRAVI